MTNSEIDRQLKRVRAFFEGSLAGKLADRIEALESILDADHREWRRQVDRQGRDQTQAEE